MKAFLSRLFTLLFLGSGAILIGDLHPQFQAESLVGVGLTLLGFAFSLITYRTSQGKAENWWAWGWYEQTSIDFKGPLARSWATGGLFALMLMHISTLAFYISAVATIILFIWWFRKLK